VYSPDFRRAPFRAAYHLAMNVAERVFFESEGKDLQKEDLLVAFIKSYLPGFILCAAGAGIVFVYVAIHRAPTLKNEEILLAVLAMILLTTLTVVAFAACVMHKLWIDVVRRGSERRPNKKNFFR
jgi:hypothetical protein